MGLSADHIFPRLMDWALRGEEFRLLRTVLVRMCTARCWKSVSAPVSTYPTTPTTSLTSQSSNPPTFFRRRSERELRLCRSLFIPTMVMLKPFRFLSGSSMQSSAPERLVSFPIRYVHSTKCAGCSNPPGNFSFSNMAGATTRRCQHGKTDSVLFRESSAAGTL